MRGRGQLARSQDLGGNEKTKTSIWNFFFFFLNSNTPTSRLNRHGDTVVYIIPVRYTLMHNACRDAASAAGNAASISSDIKASKYESDPPRLQLLFTASLSQA